MAEPRDDEQQETTGPPLGGMGGADDTDYGTDIGGVGATVGSDDDVIAPSGRWTDEDAGRDRGRALGSTRPGTESMGGGGGAGGGRLGTQSQTPDGGKTGGRQGARRGDSGLDAMAAGIHGEVVTGQGSAGLRAAGLRQAPAAGQTADSGTPPTELGGGESAHGSSYGGTESVAGGSREARRGMVDTLGPTGTAAAERSNEETPQGTVEAGRE